MLKTKQKNPSRILKYKSFFKSLIFGIFFFNLEYTIGQLTITEFSKRQICFEF